jgi:hypothetical protein
VSICCSGPLKKYNPDGIKGAWSGNPCRHGMAKRQLSESSIKHARATVSRGSLARARREWTSGTEAAVREVEEGMRFVKWVAGPNIIFISLSSVCFSHALKIKRRLSRHLCPRNSKHVVILRHPHSEYPKKVDCSWCILDKLNHDGGRHNTSLERGIFKDSMAYTRLPYLYLPRVLPGIARYWANSILLL